MTTFTALCAAPARRALWAAVLATAASFVLAAPAHATDGYFLNGISAKAKGMGGTAIALPQDALSIATNPATATEVGHRVDIGVDLFVPRRGASISGNGAGLDGNYSGNGANPFILPEAAYVRPVSPDVSIGVAFYGNGGMNTTYEQNPFAAFGGSGKAGVDLKQAFITPTLAARVAPGHSIGLSPIFVIQSFRAKGIAPFAAASADPANFTNRGSSWSFGGGVRAGYLGRLSDTLSIGAYYQSKIWTSRFKKYAGLFAERGGFDVPAAYGAGIAVNPTPKLTLAADVKHIEYSEVESVGNSLAPLGMGVPFGVDGGPGFGWKDVTAFKLGAAYEINPKWTVRAGYGHSGNPVPASQTLLNILAPGVSTHHITAGATWTSPSGLELTSYVMHAPKNRVKGEGSIPPMFGGGEANVYLGETSVGIAAGVTF